MLEVSSLEHSLKVVTQSLPAMARVWLLLPLLLIFFPVQADVHNCFGLAQVEIVKKEESVRDTSLLEPA